jgi:hypothetical protein
MTEPTWQRAACCVESRRHRRAVRLTVACSVVVGFVSAPVLLLIASLVGAL